MSNNDTKPKPFDTVSSDTLNERDLIPAFLFYLEKIDKEAGQRFNSELIADGFSYSQCGVAFGEIEEWPEAYRDDPDLRQDLLERLTDALDERAPHLCRFGVHEGNGSDFGFWPMIDWVNEMIQSGEMPSFSDLSEVPDVMTGDFAVVNDHGNLTLYDYAHEEIWAVV